MGFRPNESWNWVLNDSINSSILNKNYTFATVDHIVSHIQTHLENMRTLNKPQNYWLWKNLDPLCNMLTWIPCFSFFFFPPLCSDCCGLCRCWRIGYRHSIPLLVQVSITACNHIFCVASEKICLYGLPLRVHFARVHFAVMSHCICATYSIHSFYLYKKTSVPEFRLDQLSIKKAGLHHCFV